MKRLLFVTAFLLVAFCVSGASTSKSTNTPTPQPTWTPTPSPTPYIYGIKIIIPVSSITKIKKLDLMGNLLMKYTKKFYWDEDSKTITITASVLPNIKTLFIGYVELTPSINVSFYNVPSPTPTVLK